MAKLVWDQAGDRVYETGIDRGVLYDRKGHGVPWNGLVSVVEKTDVLVEPLYFDGRKYGDVLVTGDYSGTISAFTHPDEFLRYEGIYEVGGGLFAYNQPQDRFHLSYRTLSGDDLGGPEKEYKIHLLYSLLAVPAEKTFATMADTVTPTLFSWDVSCLPIDLANFEPTGHFVFDTRRMSDVNIQKVEDVLYGTATEDAFLPTFESLLNMLSA